MFSSAVKKFLNRHNHHVFGTFNVTYDPAEFERERDDGTVIMGLAPECRVFVYGTEISQDVESVSVTNSLDKGNECKITLHNPRGRYEINKNDLMKKWREDKDILATYTYDYFNTIDPLKWDSIVDKLAGGAYGDAGVAQAKELINMGRQAVSLGSALFSGTPPRVRGITRMVFETKFFSGFDKRVGDFIFDYRDPVQVFFKGRFSPYWYFGFSGIVTKYTSSYTYGQTQTVQIHAGDPLSIWKRSMFLNKAAFFNMANLGNRHRNTQTSTAAQMMETKNLTMIDYVKFLSYTPDFYSNVVNCNRYAHSESITPRKDESIEDALYREMRLGALIDENYMNTSQAQQIKVKQEKSGEDGLAAKAMGAVSGAAQQFWTRFTGENSYLIDCDNINYSGFSGGPNTYSFSPYNDLYLQLNEIKLKGQLSGEELEPYFNASIRFWEANHEIDTPTPPKGTGWKDTKAFGVCGIHPALKRAFIDNFNILENIWEQCYYNQKYVDRLVVSPMDKIRETVIGSVTEKRSNMQSDTNKGSNLNLFRPRLFIVAPKRYGDGERKLETEFRKLGEILNATSSSIYDTLKKQLDGIEYNLFSSTMGDVFIEPMLYDTHPLEYCDPIEPRNIIQSSKDVYFRDESTIDPTKTVTRKNTAYFFNPLANHPFFIMDKDLISLDQSFNPEMVYTSITTIGAQTQEGSIFNVMKDDFLKQIGYMYMARGNRYIKPKDSEEDEPEEDEAFNKIDPTVIGIYVADGLEKYTQYAGNQEFINNKLKEAEEYRLQLEKLILLQFFQYDFSSTLKTLVKKFLDNVEWMYENVDASEKWYPELAYEWASIKEYKESEDVENEDIDYLIEYILNKYTNVLKKEIPLFRKNIDIELETFFNSNVSNEKIEDDPSSLIQAMKDAEAGYGDSGYNTFNQSTDYYELLGRLFTYFENIKASSEQVVSDIIFIYTPTAIKDNADVLNKFKKVYDLYGDLFIASGHISENSNITSLDKLKYLEMLGLYNPRKDIVKRYGYNPLKQPIKNIYLNNGKEAIDYSKSVFNRLYGRAYNIHAVQIGRPEYFLNRPIYCEQKDAIGLLNEYTIEFKYGSTFTSSINLDFIRKNAILFDYSIENLDELVGEHDNAFFKKEADKYYLTAKLLAGGKDLVQQAGGMAGAAGGDLKKVVAEQAASEVGDLADNFLKFGGLYSAHDKHGHLNYDDSIIQTDIVMPTTEKPDKSDETKNIDSLSKIYIVSTNISYNLSREDYLVQQKNTLLTQADEESNKLHELQQEIKALNNELESASSRTSNILTTMIENKQNQIDRKMVEINGIGYSYNRTKEQLNAIYKELFGGKYTNIKSAPKDKPSDLTSFCKKQYATYTSENKQQKNVTLGLFTQLVQLHVIHYKRNIEHISVSYEGPTKELEGFGTITDYIRYSPPPPPESAQNEGIES